MKNTTEIFRCALKKHLDNNKIKQSEIADKMGIDRPAFNSFLRGKKNFSLKRQEQIAAAIGYNYIDLINSCRDLTLSDNNEPSGHSGPEHEALIDVAAIEKKNINATTLSAAEIRLLKMYRSLDYKYKQLVTNMVTDVFINFNEHSD